MPIPQRPVHGLDDVNHRRRDRETLNQVLDHSFDDSRRQTYQETVLGITPVNTAYPPGSWLRYGADPTGVKDSYQAILNSLKANTESFDDYPGGGTYLTSTEIVFPGYPRHVYGQTHNIGNGTGGTHLILSSGAGSTACHFSTSAFATGIHIEGISFEWQQTTNAQKAIRFGNDARAFNIHDCSFMGSQSLNCQLRGIQFDNPAVFSGSGTIRSNYFSGLIICIDMRGFCTSVRIYDNDLIGYTTGATSFGISVANTCAGVLANDNYLEGWNADANSCAIYSEGSYLKQVANSYEVNSINWKWVRGSGNARIWNAAVAEMQISGGAPVYPFNDVDSCQNFASPGFNSDLDVGVMRTSRGFNERQRSANMGEWTTDTYAGGNYLAGTGSWTVDSGDVTQNKYTQVGKTLFWNVMLETTSTSTTPAFLQIALPAGGTLAAQKKEVFSAYATEAGTAVACIATVDPSVSSGTVIRVSKLSGANFAAATNNLTIAFSIAFETN